MDIKVEDILARLDELPENHRVAISTALSRYNKSKKASDAKTNFLSFVKHAWPPFIEGPHHTIMGKKFNEIASGKLRRLIINIAPRHGKSELTSWLLPAWLLGQDSSRKLIAATHTTEFSQRFGRKGITFEDKEYDLFKIIHYAVILLHTIEQQEGNKKF